MTRRGPKRPRTYAVGRDARTGRFIPVKDAKRRKATAVVEHLRRRLGCQ